MASSKIAITVPEEVLAEVDAAARARGETRSGFISRILRTALRARRDAGITRRLNELFADESAVHTREFSVEPSHIPRGTFVPSIVIPRVTTTVCPATSRPSSISAASSNSSSRRDRYSSSFLVVWLTR